MERANMQDIVKMAQQVASNIAQNNDSNNDSQNLDMSKMISQVTESVSKMITPDFIDKMSGGIDASNNPTDLIGNLLNTTSQSNDKSVTSNKKVKSKIQLNQVEELEDSDEQCELLLPKTNDLNFTLNVTLEDLYNGKIKKLAVRRKKLVTDGSETSVVEEKKKIAVKIETGMFDEQVITFNKQADERAGYETGDIVITLCCDEHEVYEREGDNLLVEKEISLSEAFFL